MKRLAVFAPKIGLAFFLFFTVIAMTPSAHSQGIRVASMNVSLYGDAEGQVKRRLSSGSDAKAIQLARVIRSVRPDILLLCEIDYDADGSTLSAFAEGYLAAKSLNVGGDTSEPIEYPYRWSIPTNTGLLAETDLNEDGRKSLPMDAYGFGKYPGQYAMAVLSRFPIDSQASRTFQTLRWADLPDALQPVTPDSGEPFYSDEVWRVLRLSSKNHADVVIRVGHSIGKLHFLVSHPTPPVFDGKEDRNGKRNHDEIRLWNDYITHANASYLVDDSGASGGLPADATFVIAGDLNSDPQRGDSIQSAIQDLLTNERVNDVEPASNDHGVATALFGRREVRVDYVLPSSNLDVTDSGVVWPEAGQPLSKAVTATDHRMVWIDLGPIARR